MKNIKSYKWMVGVSLIVIVLFLAIGCSPNIRLLSSEPIYAFRDNQGATGSFFLSTGSVQGAIYYHYYVKRDGGLLLLSRPANRCLLYEISEGQPRVEYWGDPAYSEDIKASPKVYHFKIYIPEGSIWYGFEANMK